MTLEPVIVLRSRLIQPERLASFVADCLRDRVELIAIWGVGCEALEDQIDDLVLASGGFIATSSHPDETLEDVTNFAACHFSDRTGGFQIVDL